MTHDTRPDRRHFLTSLASGSLAAAAAVVAPAGRGWADSVPVPQSADDAISHYWNRPLSELVDIGPYESSPAEMECASAIWPSSS